MTPGQLFFLALLGAIGIGAINLTTAIKGHGLSDRRMLVTSAIVAIKYCALLYYATDRGEHAVAGAAVLMIALNLGFGLVMLARRA